MVLTVGIIFEFRYTYIQRRLRMRLFPNEYAS